MNLTKKAIVKLKAMWTKEMAILKNLELIMRLNKEAAYRAYSHEFQNMLYI